MADQLFTPDQIKEDAQNRVARTGVQSGTAGALVIVLDWYVSTHAHSVIGDVPTTVWAAFQLLLSTGGSWFMNRKRLKGNL